MEEQDATKNPATDEPTETTVSANVRLSPSRLAALSESLNQRADRLQGQANLISLLIFLVIGLGAVAFYFADELLVRDISDPVNRIVVASKNLRDASQGTESGVDKAGAYKPITEKIDAFLRSTLAAKTELSAADKDLQQRVKALAKTGRLLVQNEQEYQEFGQRERYEIGKLIESGLWQGAPGAPTVWPERFQPSEYALLDNWINAYTRGATKDKLEFIKPISDLRAAREANSQQGWRYRDILRDQANELNLVLEGRINLADDTLSRLEDFIRLELLTTLKDFNNKLDDGLRKAASATSTMQTAVTAVDGAAKNTQDLSQKFGSFSIYSSLVTRLSILVLLVFLVQILVSLYRYNMRLVSFYRARADALTVAGSEPASGLQSLVDMLTPLNVDFGKSPESPSQQISELARTLANNVGKLAGR